MPCGSAPVPLEPLVQQLAPLVVALLPVASAASAAWPRPLRQPKRPGTAGDSAVGVSIDGGTQKWMVYKGKIPVKMDDN